MSIALSSSSPPQAIMVTVVAANIRPNKRASIFFIINSR